MPKRPRRSDPFVAFNFEVQVDGKSIGAFSECSGLMIEHEVKDFMEGGQNGFVWKLPTRVKQSNITLKRGIVDAELWNWYFEVVQGKVTLKSGAVIIRDPAGNQDVATWEFKNAFPVKWQGPDLNATQSQVAIETLEFCHHGLSRQK